MIEFWVSGRPAPQGSKRHVGGGVMVEMSKAVGPWREAVRGEAQGLEAVPLAGAVAVALYFYFLAPKSVKRAAPSVRPDIDKLTRAVLDGLTMAQVFADDAQVTELAVSKRYGPRTGVLVRVAPAELITAQLTSAARAAGGDNPFNAFAFQGETPF